MKIVFFPRLKRNITQMLCTLSPVAGDIIAHNSMYSTRRRYICSTFITFDKSICFILFTIQQLVSIILFTVEPTNVLCMAFSYHKYFFQRPFFIVLVDMNSCLVCGDIVYDNFLFEI